MMNLDFLLVDDFKGYKVTVASEGITEEISNTILEKCKFMLDFDNDLIKDEIRLIPLNEGLLAYSYNYWYQVSKENPVQVSWILILSQEDFLLLNKSLTLLKEEIIFILQNHVYETLQVKDFDDLRKKSKKIIKKLPFRLEHLSFDESLLSINANEDFLNLREKFAKLKKDFEKALNGLLYCSQTFIKRVYEEDLYNLIEKFVKLVYYIMPAEILFNIFYSGYETSISMVKNNINFMKFRYEDSLEDDESLKEDIKNMKKVIIEIQPDKIESRISISDKEQHINFIKMLVNNAFQIIELKDIIKFENLRHKYLINEIFRKDINNLRDFINNNKSELIELSKWIKEKKTEIILLYANFNVEKKRFLFLRNNRENLELLNKIYRKYSEISEGFKQFFDKIIEDLSIGEIEESFGIKFNALKELLQDIRNCPYEFLKKEIPILLKNQRLPAWLMEFNNYKILDLIREINEFISQHKDLDKVSHESKKPPRLEIELHEIIGEKFIQMFKNYRSQKDDFFYNFFLDLFAGKYNAFVNTIIIHNEILTNIKTISSEFLLKLDKTARTNDNISFISTAVWFKIIFGKSVPETVWSENIEVEIKEIKEILSGTEFIDDLIENGWNAPKRFKEIFIRVLAKDFLANFQKFKEDYIDFYGNKYDDFLKIKEKYPDEKLDVVFNSIIESEVDDKTKVEVKIRNINKLIDTWKEDTNPPSDAYKLVLEMIKDDKGEIINSFESMIKKLEKILEYSNIIDSEAQFEKIKDYLEGKTEMEEDKKKVLLIKELMDSGCINLFKSLKDLNKIELTKEVQNYIKEGKLNDSSIIGTKFFDLFEQLLKDKEEIYSEDFKNEQLTEAINFYLETGRAMGGFLDYISFSNEIEQISQRKRQN